MYVNIYIHTHTQNKKKIIRIKKIITQTWYIQINMDVKIYALISLHTRLASEEREANGIAALCLNQQHTYFN